MSVDPRRPPPDGRANLHEGSVSPEGPRVIVGRAAERGLLEDLVLTAETGGGAAVLLGEPGMGKTALLGYARERALEHGDRVLAVRGTESEAVLPFAVIADLLLPMRELFGEVPPPQQLALEVCLALVPGPVPGVLAACAGALGVLSAAGESRPLVILVDDFQWVDPESAQILSFVARRLRGERVVVVIAVRDEPDAPSRGVELPTARLTGLSRRECGELAALNGAALSPRGSVPYPLLAPITSWLYATAGPAGSIGPNVPKRCAASAQPTGRTRKAPAVIPLRLCSQGRVSERRISPATPPDTARPPRSAGRPRPCRAGGRCGRRVPARRPHW